MPDTDHLAKVAETLDSLAKEALLTSDRAIIYRRALTEILGETNDTKILNIVRGALREAEKHQ
jgi:hypothetical protein